MTLIKIGDSTVPCLTALFALNHYDHHNFVLTELETAFTEADSCNDDQLERKGCSGALLDMLAEVASQTLHSDPSVKLSPIKRQAKRAADLNCHLSNKKKVNHYKFSLLLLK